MDKITDFKARMVLDSRGIPTIEAEITSKNGFGSAISPAGTSTGVHEAVELRDYGKAFLGKGVQKGLENSTKLVGKQLTGLDCQKQAEFDKELIKIDGTSNKGKLGANFTTALSIANCKCAADSMQKSVFEWVGRVVAGNEKFKLPVPVFNMINGGMHAGSSLQFQEFHVIPVNAETYAEALRIGSETYHSLRSQVNERFGKQALNVGLEGGFTPPLASTEDALTLLQFAVKELGYQKEVKLGLDCAASAFCKDRKYEFEGKTFENIQFAEHLGKLAEKFGKFLRYF